jgi:hypothetical protein
MITAPLAIVIRKEPVFDPVEYANLKKNTLLNIQAVTASPAGYSRYLLDSIYYVGHPYGRRTSVSDIEQSTIPAMEQHLKEISTQVAPGAHAVLVCDGAGWHRPGKRLHTPDNITLLPLPPYSPELNPMENIWDYLRGNKLSSLVWDSYEAIVDACKEAWNFLVGDPERIKSIARRSWAWVNV